MIREVSKRASSMVVKSSTPEAWETTAKLRAQYMYTTLDAMPKRIADASQEWTSVRTKIVNRDFTVNDLTTGAVRAVELYAFYLFGRVIGSKTLST